MDPIERSVRELHNVIVGCIKTPEVVSELISVISAEDISRIREMYVNGDSIRACELMLECFYKSSEPGKSRAFLDALEKNEFPYLKNLIEKKVHPDLSHVHAKKMIQLVTPTLVQELSCEDIVFELVSRNVIREHDREHIMNIHANKGNTYAVMVLLDRMQCRLSPEDWYFQFLEVLNTKGYPNILEKLEPHFTNNPSAFLPKLGPIYSNTGEKSATSATGKKRKQVLDDEHKADAEYGSIREHVMGDFVHGDTDMNDLGAPPPLPERHDSLMSSRSNSQSESSNNMKELNIKPELTKNLHIDDDIAQHMSTCVITSGDGQNDYKNSGENTGSGNNDDDNDEDTNEEDESSDDNSMASDYESFGDDTKAETHELVLRSYQLELAEIALLGVNTIVCAETGSGKTWVALHIIKEHLQKTTNGPKKVVFMARTGALIKQQFDRFQKYLPQFNSKLVTGEDEESRMLNMFLEQEYDILCFTPQILVNNLDSKAIKSLCEFSLLVLDECHHTRGDEPYNRLMRRYLIEKQKGAKRLPQVVGLTASIGVGKSRTEAEAMDYILRVCGSLDVELLSTVERNIVELRKNTNMPEEETIPLKKLQNDPCKNIIFKAMEDTEEMLQENAFLQPELIDLITEKHPRNKESQEYNKWTVDVMKQAEMKVDNHEISRDISTCAKYLNIYNSALEINKLLPNRDVIKFLAEKHRLESEHKQKLTDMEKKLFQNLLAVQKEISQKARDVENPNVRILSDTLRKMIDKKGEDSRAMVFVKARATCKALAAFLDKDMERIAVKASPLYGKESRGGDDGMTESVQTEILDRFRNGYFKILVCTSVGNEGIDVPDCNIVLSYEYSADEVTKIQMKGRARKHGATAVVMGSEAVVEQDRTNAFKAAMMYKALAKVKQLDPKVIRRKVAMFQKEETNKHQWKVDIEQMKKGRKTEEDYKILCRRCNTVACYVSDVRKMGHDHIVIDREFAEKINRKAHSKPKMYDGLHKKYKMFCKKCPLDWGIIGTRDGLDCMILKIINFKFLNLRTNGIETYKKWIDVPYQVPEITLEDLPRLIGETVPEDQTE